MEWKQGKDGEGRAWRWWLRRSEWWTVEGRRGGEDDVDGGGEGGVDRPLLTGSRDPSPVSVPFSKLLPWSLQGRLYYGTTPGWSVEV